jgi:ParB family chromosome partitioning protein
MHTTTTTQGTIEYLDPAALQIEDNVRFLPELDKDDRQLVESIKQLGVLEPIVARRDEQGTVLVRMGQRRTLAAREAEVPTVPVFVIDAADNTIRRILEQLAENDHRRDLTGAEHVAAFQQLAFEGLSVATIAKRTRHTTQAVRDALAIAENETASDAIKMHELTLDQAAALIEFESDPATVDALVEVATENPEQFAHATQRARDDQRMKAIKDTAKAELVERGFTVLDSEPGYYETDFTPIRDLVTSEGERVTEDMIADADGRAAFVRVYYSSEEATVLYYLADPKAAGFKKNGSTGGPMTDEQKAERKELIGNNKAWASAEVVRREWLTTFLGTKTLPKDAVLVAARGVTTHRREVGTAMERGNSLAHVLLGIDRGDFWSPDKLASFVDQNPTKAQHVTLAIVLAGIDGSTSKETWRRPDPLHAAYFCQLAAWGYALSEVEQIVADAHSDGSSGEAVQSAFDAVDSDDEVSPAE